MDEEPLANEWAYETFDDWHCEKAYNVIVSIEYLLKKLDLHNFVDMLEELILKVSK